MKDLVEQASRERGTQKKAMPARLLEAPFSVPDAAHWSVSWTFPPRGLSCHPRGFSSVSAVALGEQETGSEQTSAEKISKRAARRPKREKLPAGLRRYETTAILRPDISEDEKLAWTQKYEETIIAGGATSVEFSSRGIRPLAYSIEKKDTGGVSRTYFDGLYMQITYVTNPQSQVNLQRMFNADDDIIRSITISSK